MRGPTRRAAAAGHETRRARRRSRAQEPASDAAADDTDADADGFFTLDVVANLVRASLRNQRLGFFLLSASGLSILGGMVLYTLQKDRVHQALGRLRARLRKWE